MERDTRVLSDSWPTIPELIAASAQRWGNRPALWHWADDQFVPITYRQLERTLAAAAQRLWDKGVDPGSHVAVWVENRYRWGIAYLAALWSGAIVIPIDPLLTPIEIQNILIDSEARFLLGDEIAASSGLVDDSRILPLGDIVRSVTETDDSPKAAPSSFGGIASIIFTSGTSDSAKGVMLTHQNIVSDIQSIEAMGLLSHDDILLSVLPIHHAFECTVGFLYALSIGAQVAYARGLKSNLIVADLKATQATVMLGVPLLFEKMANAIKRRVAESSGFNRAMFSIWSSASIGFDRIGLRNMGRILFSGMRQKAGLSSLRLLASGGAALAPEIGQFFHTIGIPLMQGYGLTEASPVVSVNRPGRHRFDTVGPPLPNVDVQIHDPGPDGCGEIIVKGPIVMHGYWKKPDETARIIRGGWLHTGDEGKIDSDGHVQVVGRSKNVIVSGAGKNIYPEEVEAALDAQPEILESLVYAKKRSGKTGEIVAAYIVADRDWFDANPLADSTDLHVAVAAAVHRSGERLAAYKRVVEWALHDEPFERTSTRKIKRYKLTLSTKKAVKENDSKSAPVPAEQDITQSS